VSAVGEGDASEVPDNIRISLAGLLADKAKDQNAETATRMAGAANALLAPLIIRADDAAADKAAADKKADDDKSASDANLKNKVVSDETAPATLAGIMDAITKFSTDFGARLDMLEGKKKAADGEHTMTPSKDKDDKKAAAADDDMIRLRVRLMRGDNRIRLDSMFREDARSEYHSGMNEINQLPHAPETQDFFAAVQTRADSVYSELARSPGIVCRVRAEESVVKAQLGLQRGRRLQSGIELLWHLHLSLC
jgi:hypothetical protein